MLRSLLLTLLPLTAAAQAPPSAPPPERRFAVDELADGAVLSLSLGFGALSQAILSTGEIRPQPPSIPTDDLLLVDRWVAQSEGNETSGLISDIAAGAVGVYVVVDALRAGASDGGDSGWTYALLYAESAACNWALTNLTKIAVRRPRPRAYLARDRAERAGRDFEGSSETDDALSFYSGHTAITAGLTATATYMAFVRGDDELEGWLTLAGGAVLTGVVGWQRVSVRAHFPTDVIAGAMAGAGVGVLVPHLHHVEPGTLRHVQVGLAQDADGHQLLSLSGRF